MKTIMKRLFLSFLFCAFHFSFSTAQALSTEIQVAYNACKKMAAAIASGNTTELKSANLALKKCDISSFSSLRCFSDNPLSLNGHFVFNEDFVDSLIAGRNVYKFAQQYAVSHGSRGIASSSKVFMRNCAVQARKSEKFSFVSRGHQELAVVTEPGGLITLRIHDKTNDKWYNDTRNVKKGQSYRTAVFDLPVDKRNTIEIEVINLSGKDISFVLISN